MVVGVGLVLGAIAFALLSEGDPVGPRIGTYRGSTSQGRPFEFDVVTADRTPAIGRIKFEVQSASATCPDKVEVTNPTRGWIVPIVDNEFSDDIGDVAVSGKFLSAATAGGDLNLNLPGLPPYDPGCKIGPVTWSASISPS